GRYFAKCTAKSKGGRALKRCNFWSNDYNACPLQAQNAEPFSWLHESNQPTRITRKTESHCESTCKSYCHWRCWPDQLFPPVPYRCWRYAGQGSTGDPAIAGNYPCSQGLTGRGHGTGRLCFPSVDRHRMHG